MRMLAFDLGASSGKLFVGNYNGSSLQLENVGRFEHSATPVRGELFWDTIAIYKQLIDGITSVVSQYSITSVGIDSFSNDFGLLDDKGRLVSQTHCYRDARTKRNEESIYSRISKEELHEITGNQSSLFSTFMQLASMMIEGQAYLLKGSGKLLKLPDLLIYFLTGSMQCEYTLASVSQVMDMTTGDWSTEILRRFGIPSRIFPEIVPTGNKVGKIVDLAKPIEVVAVCEHDTASAFLGAPEADDAILISSGTWSLIGVETDGPIITQFTYEHNIANEGGYPGHHRLLKNVMGLWLLQESYRWYASQGFQYSLEDYGRLAKLESPFVHMIDPDDGSFFSPGDMPKKIAKYCLIHHQSQPESPGQVIRCIFESLALKYRYVIEELEALVGRQFRKVNILGGGSNNSILNQMVADVTNRTVYAGPADATVLGNMMVQLLSYGELSSIAEGRKLISQSFPVQRFEPQNPQAWADRYQEFVQMITNERM
ncbi:MAG TPA: rhamnulokinase [Firmicutes bacterium]|nr:rhamnulokinase [Bacillota bacterium]